MDKLLVIGEELWQDQGLRSTIEREGFEVLKAAGRQDGLALLQSEQPVCVMIQHHLESDNGVELLKEVRHAYPRTELIFTTPGGEMDAAIEVLRAGALDYLTSPVDLNQLRLSLGRARERRLLRQTPDKPTILVLEDQEPTLRRIVQLLEKEGFQALGAADGVEGMRLFAENRVDLILADLKMPKKGGLEVLSETKSRGADVEVIVMTGYGDETDVVQALRSGAINFLRKPIDIDQMLLAIGKALEFQNTRRSLAYRNREVQLMQELVVRLTHRLELIVEAPAKMSPEAVGFLHRLIDALPLGIVVAGGDLDILFANRHVVEKVGTPARISPEWLSHLGISNVTEEQLQEAFRRAMGSGPGTIETLVLSRWSFLVMTPLKLMQPDGSHQFVALAIRGERSQLGSSA